MLAHGTCFLPSVWILIYARLPLIICKWEGNICNSIIKQLIIYSYQNSESIEQANTSLFPWSSNAAPMEEHHPSQSTGCAPLPLGGWAHNNLSYLFLFERRIISHIDMEWRQQEPSVPFKVQAACLTPHVQTPR